MNTFLDIHGKQILRPEGESIHWRIAAYAVVLSEDKTILTVTEKKDPDHYMLPGGGIEAVESIPEGVMRECYEETGYRVKLSDTVPFFVGETYFFDAKYYHCVNLFYHATLVDGMQNAEAINQSEDEIASVDWVPVKDINNENCKYVVYPAIQTLLQP